MKIVSKASLGLLLSSALLGACGGGGGAEAAPAPGVISGKATDTSGKPLAGAVIILDVFNHADMLNDDHSTNQYDDTDQRVTTGANGVYSVRPGGGGWRLYGSIERAYHGETFSMPLHPDNPQWVAGDKGGVRNFQWKLSGAIPEQIGGGFYGGLLKVVTTYDSGFREEAYPEIEVVLDPVGPLIDGSEGQQLVRQPDRDGQIQDVPIGRYRMQARRSGQPLALRVDDNQGAFAPAVTVDFKSRGDMRWGYCTNCAQVELRER